MHHGPGTPFPPACSPLERQLAQRLDRRRANSTLRSLTVAPPSSVDFSSNDFLSLAGSAELRAYFLCELAGDRSGCPPLLGSRGSRLLDGNSAYAEAVEREVAAFHGAAAGLLCNSGFDANAGLFACVPQAGDAILYDELIHASVHDGMKLSRASRRVAFEHNSADDLGRRIEELLAAKPSFADGHGNVFVAVEAIYSMDGDLAPLAQIVELVERLLPRANGHVVVDEAHATGVLGPQGRGLVCELGLEKRVFARLHTFGKSLACSGAIILSSPIVRHYLVNYARPMIYTTFMSFPSLAAIRASYRYLEDGKSEILSSQLQNLIAYLHERLYELLSSLEDSTGLISMPMTRPRSPIFSVLTTRPRELAKHCQESGFIVRAVVPPTVPAGKERIRVCLHAGNTKDEIDGFISRLQEWLESRLAECKPLMARQSRL
ncbi:aminotransferase [Lineolata rhizophorae]|uniref:Aminotransferase n=1 Tax=Lineolata rhizophorae TaxID=578093 RepID=A0A6A6NTX4_9PEZI|nr:aminotransferase [Lineolata rhizophorae]